jgi:hypothetical protein
MPRVGFETPTRVFERAKTVHILDHATTFCPFRLKYEVTSVSAQAVCWQSGIRLTQDIYMFIFNGMTTKRDYIWGDNTEGDEPLASWNPLVHHSFLVRFSTAGIMLGQIFIEFCLHPWHSPPQFGHGSHYSTVRACGRYYANCSGINNSFNWICPYLVVNRVYALISRLKSTLMLSSCSLSLLVFSVRVSGQVWAPSSDSPVCFQYNPFPEVLLESNQLWRWCVTLRITGSLLPQLRLPRNLCWSSDSG